MIAVKLDKLDKVAHITKDIRLLRAWDQGYRKEVVIQVGQ
jgi:hypothetical protein